MKLPKINEHPKGWNSEFSHQRKLNSYKIEVNWYEEFSTIVDKRCRIPQGLKTLQSQNEWLIVMEDLATAGFESIVNKANKIHLQSCLSWLANFHARFIGTQCDMLWETGTYWHLDTRPDELAVLEDKELKESAKDIDAVLKKSKYQTIVHGDAKLANFCFSSDGTQCAAVDFQYVGHGCAMKDVAYFMSSAVEANESTKMQEWILDTYFSALNEALDYYQPKLDANDVEKEWRSLFAISWADFHRFVKGWSPNHYKINDYSESLTKSALDDLKSKQL